MIGLCLVLLLGGAPPSAPVRLAEDPAGQCLFHAVVVPAPVPQGDELPDDAEDAGLPGEDPDGSVPLRKAAVQPTPDPAKEP